MDPTLCYYLSLSGFLTIALWHMRYGRKISRLEIKLPIVMVFMTLGVLSLKFIDVLPLEWVPWFKYPTIIMCLVGGMSMLITLPTQKKVIE